MFGSHSNFNPHENIDTQNANQCWEILKFKNVESIKLIIFNLNLVLRQKKKTVINIGYTNMGIKKLNKSIFEMNITVRQNDRDKNIRAKKNYD